MKKNYKIAIHDCNLFKKTYLTSLDYMVTSKGRKINAQHWAGLLLIADKSSNEMELSYNFRCWILALITIAIVVAIMKWKIKSKK